MEHISIKENYNFEYEPIKVKTSQMSPNYTPKSIFTALIIVFIFHNIEEAVSICSYPVQSLVAFIVPATCRQFIVAVSLITAVVLFAFGIAIRTKKPTVYLFLSTAIASGLVLKVLVPHIFIAIYTSNYTPGLLSAVAFNLPLGLITLSKNKRMCSGKRQFYQYIVTGLVAGYLLFAVIMRLVLYFIS